MLKTELCRYRYDPLDQLIWLEPEKQEKLQRFYRLAHLTTELRAQSSQSVFQHDMQLLALHLSQGDAIKNQLLTTDQQRSVLQVIEPGGSVRQVYTAYGHQRAERERGCLLGFNGEAVDRITGHYLLGNGHRAFNPVLMRFNSPDRLSPFGRGGLNPYAYCVGDPVNFSDPAGQSAVIARILSSIGALFNSVMALRPGIPFQVALDALSNGAAFQLPARHVVGAMSSVTAGITGVASAVVGVASTVTAAINPTSALLAPMAQTALGLTGTSVAGRLGSWWAARNPAVLPALKRLADGSPVPVASTASLSSRRLSFTAIQMEQFSPTAPPLTPGTPQASAPPLTASFHAAEQFNFIPSQSSFGTSGGVRRIRRGSF